jgi:hypothetical protein
MKNIIVLATASLMSLLSFSVMASPAPADKNSLEKMILANVDQKRAEESRKYAQLIALAGEKQGELEKRKNDVMSAYKKWYDLKYAVEVSHGYANAKNFKALQLASQSYSDANKAFVDLQKEIVMISKGSQENQAAYLIVSGI